MPVSSNQSHVLTTYFELHINPEKYTLGPTSTRQAPRRKGPRDQTPHPDTYTANQDSFQGGGGGAGL